MKKLILISVFIILATCNFAYAQKVEVDQSFVDSANKAFLLVIEQRDALEKFKLERAKTDIERASADALIKGMNEFIALKDRQIGQYELLAKIQQNIITFQQEIIERLEKMLKRPKSLFDKILRTLERIALVVGGIIVGKGLSGF